LTSHWALTTEEVYAAGVLADTKDIEATTLEGPLNTSVPEDKNAAILED